MRHRVGDIVRIRTWYSMANDFCHTCNLIMAPGANFVLEMKDFCGKDVEITEVFPRSYRIKEDKGNWRWTDAMIEESQQQ